MHERGFMISLGAAGLSWTWTRDLAREVNFRTYDIIQLEDNKEIILFLGAIHSSRTQHTTLCCTALSKCAYSLFLFFINNGEF